MTTPTRGSSVPPTVLGLDFGTKRIGVARASLIARLPEPLTTLENTSDAPQQLLELVRAQNAVGVVIGLPRGLKGQETSQTGLTRQYIESLKGTLPVPVYTQDEALTSNKAKNELATSKVGYTKGDVDALAATYILEDFLRDNEEFTQENS